mmetsp:Transcript_18646/g.26999  ORF Transcript_18646/g.26999 Transcript_18646/m.26999 type:complete len:127 (-) Transcript_18646:131-511(-)
MIFLNIILFLDAGKKNQPEGEASFCFYYVQSMCLYKTKLILFGGSTGEFDNNHVFAFNLTTLQIEKLVTTGSPPSPRYKHQAEVVRDVMYVFGAGDFKPCSCCIDIYAFDLKALVLTRIKKLWCNS